MILGLRRRKKSRLSPPEHAVTFYRDDDALLDQLVTYVSERGRATAVVIATPEHRAALAQRLGTDSFLGLDAEETLQLFMVGGRPDPQLFEDSVGALVRAQVAAGLRAYGEMVALLWSQGNVTGTLELEELWNDLQREVAFPLLCAYPMSEFEHRGGLGSICDTHTHVAPSVRGPDSSA